MNIAIQFKDPADLEARVTFTATIRELRLLDEQLRNTPSYGLAGDFKEALRRTIANVEQTFTGDDL